MKLKTMQILEAFEAQQMDVQKLTAAINKYEGMNVKTDHIRHYIHIGYVNDTTIEPYIRLILDLSPPDGFEPVKRVINHKKEYKKRLAAQENAQAYMDDHILVIREMISKLGGYKLLGSVLGLKEYSIERWPYQVSEEGTRGYIPEKWKPQVIDYARRINVDLSDIERKILSPTQVRSRHGKYKYVYSRGESHVARITRDGEETKLGPYNTLKKAVINYNIWARENNYPVHDEAGL